MLNKYYFNQVLARLQHHQLMRAGREVKSFFIVAILVFWVSVAQSMMQ